MTIMKNSRRPPEDLSYERYLRIIRRMPEFFGKSRKEKEAAARELAGEETMDLTLDFAFKYVFSGHLDILQMFLDDLLPLKIRSLELLPGENLRLQRRHKKVMFDVICKTDTGERVLVEMQRAAETDFRDRMIYYGSELIHGQKESGDREYDLDSVCIVCICGFGGRHPGAPADQAVFRYRIREDTTIYLLELERITDSVKHPGDPVAEWMSVIKNFRKFVGENKGNYGRFKRLVEVARQDTLPEKTLKEYITAMFTERDRLVVFPAYYQKGLEEGRTESKREIASALRKEGVATSIIIAATGLTAEEIDACAAAATDGSE